MLKQSNVFGILLATLASGAASAADVRVQQVPAEAAFLPVWTLVTSSELSYATFKGSRGFTAVGAPNNVRGSGNQTYLNTSYSLSGNPSSDLKLDFVLKGGYVRSEQTTFNFTGRYSGPTDTTASGTFTYLGIDGVQPYLSLNFNLPTGSASLLGFGGRARLDPDLVAVPSYGEGFNFGPTLGVNVPVTPELMFNLSGGVTIREAYFREGVPIAGTNFQPFSKYAPGTASSLSASVTYADGPFTAQGSLSYTNDTTAYVDNIATSRSGRRFGLSLFTAYAINEQLSLSFNGSANFGTNNYVVRPDTPFAGFPNGILSYPNGVLTAETSNSNNSVYQGKVSLTYAFTPAFALTPFVSILYRANNSFDVSSNQFSPAKTRYSFGANASYAINDQISLTGRLEHIRTYEHGTSIKFDPLLLAVAGNGFVQGSEVIPLNYTGWQVAGGVSFRF